MLVEKRNIQGIPAILWGSESKKWILAVHGSRSSKIDDCIWILAEEAILCGYQVLSFDLPKHGERVYEEKPCLVQQCIEELIIILNYVKQQEKEVSLFGCSMGAYVSLLAYRDERIDRTWLLSPVVDMAHVIQTIMGEIGVTEEQLEIEEEIDNPIEPLSWEYYSYVKEHPVIKWQSPTSILRGEHDYLCEYRDVFEFAERFQCKLEEQKGGEHWFHTPKQLEYYRKWLQKELQEEKG